MRAVIQRTLSSQVISEGIQTGKAGFGLTVLLGVGKEDGEEDVQYMADKITNLRVFEDDQGKMNRSLMDVGGDMLVISQFTLYGDVRHGRRPGFDQAAPPVMAEALYENFVAAVRRCGISVGTGVFRTEMVVTLANHGPVTILIDSKKKF
ncbi:MAG: D-aminoacyl-tRNA deacylase [Megasphaera sp.]|jgi:D-tyrosyl-tRNA(Tyr) deacylase|uniref:D-aminoacyl-tRNA deacylase n=1 Tax=Megasphaera sueciensis TaxID=349094 RepID=UPI003D072379|nr:D-aminoacyl-tRNA deacylase [Megasphaera sp.]MCI1823401.1 D-aminoacyl-tRNA deacylase [Megasphaera sp.]